MNLAVIAGVAVTTAVLVGALMVGDSLRGSLRSLTLDRLGTAEYALINDRFFPADLATRLGDQPALAERTVEIVPAVIVRGAVIATESQRRASEVQILGIDDSFASLYPAETWSDALDLERLPGQVFPSVVLNEPLQLELGASVGDEILLTLGRPTAVPTASLMGRREERDVLATLRLTVSRVIPANGPGRFGLEARQTRPLNAFVDLSTLQRRLDRRGRVNLLLLTRQGRPNSPPEVDTELRTALADSLEMRDLGLAIERQSGSVGVASEELLVRPGIAESVRRVASEVGATTWPYLTYLANRLVVGDRVLPYSTVTAVTTPIPEEFGQLVVSKGASPDQWEGSDIALSSWAAADLDAQVGDTLTMDYYLVGIDDELTSASTSLEVAAIVEMRSLGADAQLTPDVPGVSDAADMAGWDPPFPVDLGLVRPQDEAYWDDYRGTPKAFLPLASGQELWRSRYGQLTALRLAPTAASSLEEIQTHLEDRLPRDIGAEQTGFRLLPIRARGLAGASGTTDFAGLFVGFSIFLIISAALLVALLFALLVEGRAAEAGLLLATGFPVGTVRRRFLGEGLVLAGLGTLAGIALAYLYTYAVLRGLARWWSPILDAPILRIHVQPSTLLAGGVLALLLVTLVIVWTVRRLSRTTARELLSGKVRTPRGLTQGRRATWTAGVSLGLALLLIVLSMTTGTASAPALFFGVGGALLVAGIAAFAAWAGGSSRSQILQPRWLISRLAARNSARSLGRSLLSVTLVASASFVLVSVSANRKTYSADALTRTSGTGGYDIVAESQVPLSAELAQGLETGLAEFSGFRRLPGDDASCLNLYQPERPRVLGVPADFVNRGGFRFRSAISPTDNPWTLLQLPLEDGVIPAIGDYNSVRWILHSGLGQELSLVDDHGETVRLRLVGLLDTSIFQSEVLIAEEMFLRHFPDHAGYAFFLGQAIGEIPQETVSTLESRLSAFGLDAELAVTRLAGFQAVENMYLTTFEVLGGLGLILGTLGLGIVLLRNTLERRAELAAMRSFGYTRAKLSRMVVAENAFLLIVGLTVGSAAGLIAVAPHLVSGGIQVPWGSLATILLAVFATGLLSSLAAVARSLRVPLLPALKTD